jgi:hypothetical protein
MLLSGGTLNGRRYLSAQSVATMRQVFTPDVKPSGWLEGTGYGLAFEVVDKPEGTLLLHSPGTFGNGGAFGIEGWMDPKNDLVQGNATTAHNAREWRLVVYRHNLCLGRGPPLFMMIEWFCIGWRRKKPLPELTAERSMLSAER